MAGIPKKTRGPAWRVLLLLILFLLAAPASVRAQYSCVTNADGMSVTITNYAGPGGSVVIPGAINGLAVTGIAKDAFLSCQMTSVTIPGSVTTIGPEAFYSCGNLTTVAIPSSVTNIGPGAFAVCIDMRTITVSAQNAYYSSAQGLLFDKSQATLVEFPSGLAGSYTIPGTVTNLAVGAFEGCTSLTHVTIPANIANISDYVFENCYDITGVTLPATITNIGDYAFYGCNGLGNITIPTNTSHIGTNAFYGCYDLTSVTIPNSVTNFGAGPFEWCIALTSISVAAGNPSFSSSNGVLFDKSQDALVQFPGGLKGSYTIPGIVNTISASAFAGCDSLKSISIPLSVTSIGDNAFYECYDLANITIPASVTRLGTNLFYGCDGLTNVTIAAGITNIGSYDFYGCYGLTSVTLPASVSSLGDGAFEFCIHLTNMYFLGNAPSADATVFAHDTDFPTIYYLPGATGWSTAFAGEPAVLWNAQIQVSDGNFGVQNNQFGFDIAGTADIPIVVEACTNLADPQWTSLQSATLTNGLLYFSDPQWTDFPGRFYRVITP